MQSIDIIHQPLGDQHPYEIRPYQRNPQRPFPNDQIEIGLLTKPIKEVSKVIITYWSAHQPNKKTKKVCSFVESIGSELEYSEDGHLSEASARAGLITGVDSWKARIPAFPGGTTVYYQISAVNGKDILDSEIFSYRVRKIITLGSVSKILHTDRSLVIDLQDTGGQDCFHLVLRSIDRDHLQLSMMAGQSNIKNPGDYTAQNEFQDSKISLQLGSGKVIINPKKFSLQYLLREKQYLSLLFPVQIVVGEDDQIEEIVLSFESPPGEGFYGFGERFNALNQRGQSLDIRVYEQYKEQGKKTYLPMPLFLSSLGYGFLSHNSRYSLFDLAKSVPDQWTLRSEIDGKSPLVFDFILGDPSRLMEIISRLNTLTGRPILPPPWAFGLWISSNEWNTQIRVEEVIKRHEELDIPVSVLVLEAWSDEETFYIWNDAHYDPKPGGEYFKYQDFTFQPEGMWPDPKGMVEGLHSKGLRVLLWQIPAQKTNAENHPQLAHDTKHMLDQGYCVKQKSGDPYQIIPFWFHDGLVMDFTNENGSKWWFAKREYLLKDLGIDGFKTDGGEHIWGRDLIFSDGRTSAELWNEYPNLYAGSYFNFIREHKPDAITFSRAGYTGAQAFPCHWAGDENSTWEAFRSSILAGLNAGISGIPFWGWDIAGFSGEIPTAELYLRSTAMAVFCPIMQYHSEFNEHREPVVDRTPWNIAERTDTPEVISIFRNFVRIRTNLQPYILNAAQQSVTTGLPMIRAFNLVYPEDPTATAYPYQYTFGDSLLIAPITEPDLKEATVYLPEGEWYSFWDDSRFEGNTIHKFPAVLDQIPVFIKADTLLPLNLDNSFLLGSDVGNQMDSYQNLCFKLYPKVGGESSWFDIPSQSETCFSWKEISEGVFSLGIEELSFKINLMLPKNFQFDPKHISDTGINQQILTVLPGTDIRVSILKTA